MHQVIQVVRVLFQFTPLREGRRCHQHLVARHRNISIHAPPRGATTTNTTRRTTTIFQFTPLREGRLKRSAPIMAAIRFQFTPLREGRLVVTPRRIVDATISIHAPPRGATVLHGCAGHRHSISIHAPPRGATAEWLPTYKSEVFQFTPLREGRRERSDYIITVPKFQFTPLREGRRN